MDKKQHLTNGTKPSTSAPRQQLLDYMLPADEAARRARVRRIRHHFLCLIEDLPEVGQPISPGKMKKVKQFLHRLMKSDAKHYPRSAWDGTATFQIKRLAREWMVTRNTVGNWLLWSRHLGFVETVVTTDGYRVPRTTVQIIWSEIAKSHNPPRTTLPNEDEFGASQQCPTVDAQCPTVDAQCPTVDAQCPAVGHLSGYRLPVDPASTSQPSATWSAAAAELLRSAPSVNPSCLASAIEAGCSPADVIAVAKFWRSRPGAWGVGALFRRVQHAMPGLEPSEGWPPPRSVASTANRPAGNQSTAARIEAIRHRVLREYRAPPGMPIDQVARERDQAVARALAAAGLCETLESVR